MMQTIRGAYREENFFVSTLKILIKFRHEIERTGAYKTIKWPIIASANGIHESMRNLTANLLISNSSFFAKVGLIYGLLDYHALFGGSELPYFTSRRVETAVRLSGCGWVGGYRCGCEINTTLTPTPSLTGNAYSIFVDHRHMMI